MNALASRLKQFQITGAALAGWATLILASLTAWSVTNRLHLVLAYNDAMSHLNIARRMIDNLQPGLSQIGTVWLPVSHLLYLPFIWNNWAWHSGLAGSVVSMASYVLGAVGIYLITRALAGGHVSALVATTIFAINPNLLYLQSTPLTETLYLAEFIWAVYCCIRFIQTEDSRYLIVLGGLGFMQVLTRYDGWFVAMVTSGVVLVHQLAMRRNWKIAAGRTILVSTPAVFAMLLWLLWNASFGNPFFFAFGSGSAMAQQAVIAHAGDLATKGNLVLSAWVYILDSADNVGLQLFALGLFGLGYWVFTTSKLPLAVRLLSVALLVAPFIFNIVALALGFSTIAIPELGSYGERSGWFNVRYGILALPLTAVAIGLFARWHRVIAGALLVVAVLQSGIILKQGPITVLDGTKGASAFTDADTAAHLQALVPRRDHILMSFSSFSPVAMASGLDLGQYIHEGVESQWRPALSDPADHAQWIVMDNYDVGDPVYTAIAKRHPELLKPYRSVYKGAHATIYELDAPLIANNR